VYCGAQNPVADFGHLQVGVHLGGDALEFALFFELRDEVAKIVVFHGVTFVVEAERMDFETLNETSTARNHPAGRPNAQETISSP
jgi:hypothetical protein